MQNKKSSARFGKLSSPPVLFINVLFAEEIGPVRMLVPDGAMVEFEVCPVESSCCYVLLVFVNDECLGCYCDDRTQEMILFESEEGACRLAVIRNAAWAGCRSVEGVA